MAESESTTSTTTSTSIEVSKQKQPPNEESTTHQPLRPRATHRPFGLTARDEKRQRRIGTKKAQRVDRKIMAMRQEQLADAIEELCSLINDEQTAPTYKSRAGVCRTMEEIGKWTKKLEPELRLHQEKDHNCQISIKGRTALTLVAGHRAACDYRKGRVCAEWVFHQLDALQDANEEIRLLCNPGKKKANKSRRRNNKAKGQPTVARPLLLDVGGSRSAEDALSDIHRYIRQYCRRPPSCPSSRDQFEELQDHLSRLLGCRNVTKKRQAVGRVPVGKNDKHQSLSGMMIDAVYAAVYEFLDKNTDVNLSNEGFFAKRRMYHLSRARRKGEEHHTSY